MEFLFAAPRQQLSKVQLESFTVEDSEISVLNLGAWFDGHSCEQSLQQGLVPSIFHQTDPKISIGRHYQSPGPRLCNISA